MRTNVSASELTKALRRALLHLYDPVELRQNPLPDLLGLPQSENRVGQVRHLLERAIDAQKPDAGTPTDSPARRYHDLLIYRFIEQSGQKEVATDMAISLRHLQRLESAALRTLAEHLATQHNLLLTEEATEEADDDSEQVQQEINWLKQSYPTENISVASLLDPVLERLQPVMGGLRISRDLPDLPPIAIQVIPMQQALLHLLGVIAQVFQEGRLKICARKESAVIVLEFSADCNTGVQPVDQTALAEGLPLAESLVSAAGGMLNIQPLTPTASGCLFAVLTMKASPESRLVMVVDDNHDTLLLLERYLANSPYTFLGLRQPEKLMAMLDERPPEILMLDVMLPGIDGWTLLSNVRQHPDGSRIPVIISTILPQEKLALMLGADAFLKKPFTAQELLETLNRLL